MDIRNLSFAHQKGGPLFLEEISTNIPQGKITTIIGPNGSGKSTLLELMAGNRKPNAGTLQLDEKELNSYSAKALGKKLAVVYQQQVAPADLTVEKLVRYGRQPHRKWLEGWSKEDEGAVGEALDATEMAAKRDKPLATLSGGERQRAWIAMALAQKTALLFLDEPTTFLDLYHQYEVLDLLARLNRSQGLTIVMVLHDLNQALRYSHHLIVMNDGAIKAEGQPSSILTPNLVHSVYGLHMTVHEDPNAGLFMLPVGISRGGGL